MSSFKRQQQKYVKKPYRMRNWAEYEAGLRSRGSLTVWIGLDEDCRSIPGWDPPERVKKKPGRQRRYSGLAIETCLRIRAVYHQPLRQTEGFLKSLFALLNLTADVPDHTTVSRRSAKLGRVHLGNRESNKPVHIIIDSTGLSVHVGLLRKPPKNRDYRKLHLGVDEKSGDIIACNLTSKSATDASRVPALLCEVDRPIASFRADSQYDAEGVYRRVETHRQDRSPRVLIPPKKNAAIKPDSAVWRERNRNIRSRARHGKRVWHQKSGYSLRAKVETAVSRYKTIFGPKMRSRKLAAQRAEARICCQSLNAMTGLGMPDGYMEG